LPQVLGGANPVAGPYFNFTVPEPTGVVAVLAPDEPPLLGLVTRRLPPLVGGNAVVAVASEQRPLASIERAEPIATSDRPGAVEDPDSARAAPEQLAEALVVRGDPAAVRDASSLPILWRADVSLERASTSADAYLLVFDALDEDDGRLEELHAQAVELGLDCAVEVRDEEELEQALERVDPEIFLLSPVEREDDETPLEVVLEMLAAVPAGKLAIADLQLTNREE